MRTPGSAEQVRLFMVIALVLVAIACVNFTNLATARAAARAREVALRKVLGATRAQLVGQFLAEYLLVAVASAIIGLAAAELALPWFGAFVDRPLSLPIGTSVPAALALALLTTLMGGWYPATVLSGIRIGGILRANRSNTEASTWIRPLLVGLQFGAAVALWICTLVVWTQTQHLSKMDRGYTSNGLLEIRGLQQPQARAAAATLQQRLQALPGVEGVTRDNAPGDDGGYFYSLLANNAPAVTLSTSGVDYNFFDVYRTRLLAGRLLAEQHAGNGVEVFADVNGAARVNAVINQSAARRLGFATAEAALGAELRNQFHDPPAAATTVTVVGVISDTWHGTVRREAQPRVFLRALSETSQVVVRIEGPRAAAYSLIEAAWRQTLPELPFRAGWVDEELDQIYAPDRQRAAAFGFFSILAIVIACMGIYGMAAFMSERRSKEIAIRKVVGARTDQIVGLMLFQFLRPVLVANLIAWPVAWWLMRGWLDGFHVRIDLSAGYFVLTAAAAALIAALAVGGHAWRAASSAPMGALRSE